MAEYDLLIREALVKHGAITAEARLRVYHAARQVVEKSLVHFSPEVIAKQRAALEYDIANIEADYADVEGVDNLNIDEPPPPPPTVDVPDSMSPPMPPPSMFEGGVSPVADLPTNKKSGFWRAIKFFIYICLFGGIIYFSYSYISVDNFRQRTGDIIAWVNNMSNDIFGFDSSINNLSAGWLTIFDARLDIENIKTLQGASSELNNQSAIPFVLLRSQNALATSNIRIEIPADILNKLRGQVATFEFVVRAADSLAQEFLLQCEFQQLGDCGRETFIATTNPEAYIIVVLLQDAVLQNENAYLIFNSDLTGQARGLELYSIRVRIHN